MNLEKSLLTVINLFIILNITNSQAASASFEAAFVSGIQNKREISH